MSKFLSASIDEAAAAGSGVVDAAGAAEAADVVAAGHGGGNAGGHADAAAAGDNVSGEVDEALVKVYGDADRVDSDGEDTVELIGNNWVDLVRRSCGSNKRLLADLRIRTSCKLVCYRIAILESSINRHS